MDRLFCSIDGVNKSIGKTAIGVAEGIVGTVGTGVVGNRRRGTDGRNVGRRQSDGRGSGLPGERVGSLTGKMIFRFRYKLK